MNIFTHFPSGRTFASAALITALLLRLIGATTTAYLMLPMLGCVFTGDEDEELIHFDPEEYGVSISSPDGSGYVTVIGNEVARPNTIVVARITRPRDFVASASVSESALIRNLDERENPANRYLSRPVEPQFLEICGSTLPTCPSVLGSETCQVEADRDGSFALQIPGLVGELVNLNYINPINCLQTSILDGGFIENTSIGMDMMAYDLAYDADNDRIYAVGNDRGGESIRIFVASSHAQTAATSLSGVDVPEHVNVFATDASDGKMMFIGGDDAAMIGSLPEVDSIDSNLFYEFHDASGDVLPDLVFASANDFSSVTDPSCTGLTAETYTRAFLHDGTSLYFHEFDGSIDQGGAGEIDESSRSIRLNPLDYSIVDSSGISYEVLSIPFAQIISDPLSLEDSLYLTAEVQTASAESTFLFIKVDTDDIDFCGHNDFAAASAFDVGSDEEGLQITVFNGKGVYANTTVFMGFLKKATQEIVLLDTQTYVNMLDYGIDNLSHEANDGVLTYPLDITEPVSAIAGFGRLDDDVEELLVFGDHVGGSDFLVYKQVESTLETEDPQFAFTPRNNFYFPSEAPFIVLDSGISDEEDETNFSIIRFYDLTPE